MVLAALDLYLLFHTVDLHLNFHLIIKLKSRFALNCPAIYLSYHRISSGFIGNCIRVSLEEKTLNFSWKVKELRSYPRNCTLFSWTFNPDWLCKRVLTFVFVVVPLRSVILWLPVINIRGFIISLHTLVKCNGVVFEPKIGDTQILFHRDHLMDHLLFQVDVLPFQVSDVSGIF